MSCPSADTLLLDELGELPVNRREAVRAHVDGCRPCLAERTSLRTMMADLRPSSANDDGQLFTARVLAAARSLPQAPRAIPRRGRARAAFFTAALAAASVAAVWLVTRHETERPIAGTFAARGGPSTGERLSAEILLVRDGRLLPLAGRAMRKSDALAVRVTNLSGSDMHVMAFAATQPATCTGCTRRTSTRARTRIGADRRRHRRNACSARFVQPDAPRVGSMRFVTLLSQLAR